MRDLRVVSGCWSGVIAHQALGLAGEGARRTVTGAYAQIYPRVPHGNQAPLVALASPWCDPQPAAPRADRFPLGATGFFFKLPRTSRAIERTKQAKSLPPLASGIAQPSRRPRVRRRL